MSGKAKEVVRRGSGNIFADLGMADAETHLLKARLVSRLQSLIEGRGLTQTQAAEVMGITAQRLSELGLVDKVVEEPLGGAHRDYDAVAASLDESLGKFFDELYAQDPAQLVLERQNKIRQYGFYSS